MSYLWLKALHVIFVIAWFAGLFYIFRLFVYHAKHQKNSEMCAVFETMEQKLLKIIVIPGSVMTLLFGILMLLQNMTLMEQPWMHIKLTGVVGLFAYQFFAYKTFLRFKNKDFFLSEKQCRFLNEIPTLFLFLIVIMVILRPFV